MLKNRLLHSVLLSAGLVNASIVEAQEAEKCNFYHAELYGNNESDIISTEFNETTGIYNVTVHMNGLETSHPDLAAEIQTSPMLGANGEYNKVSWFTGSNTVILETSSKGQTRNVINNTWAHSSSDPEASIVAVDIEDGIKSAFNPFISPEIYVNTMFNRSAGFPEDSMIINVTTYPALDVDEHSGLVVHNGTELNIRFSRRFKDNKGLMATPHISCKTEETIPFGGSRINGFEINFK